MHSECSTSLTPRPAPARWPNSNRCRGGVVWICPWRGCGTGLHRTGLLCGTHGVSWGAVHLWSPWVFGDVQPFEPFRLCSWRIGRRSMCHWMWAILVQRRKVLLTSFLVLILWTHSSTICSTSTFMCMRQASGHTCFSWSSWRSSLGLTLCTCPFRDRLWCWKDGWVVLDPQTIPKSSFRSLLLVVVVVVSQFNGTSTPKGHTVPKQVKTIATSIQVATV